MEVEFCRRILGERGYEEGALEYERELEHVGGGPGAIRFELVLLGVGSDGHICSMFPGQESLDERSRFAVGVPEAGLEPFVPRVTLTFPALSRAKRVLVLATGAGKADPIAAAFADDAPRTTDVPGVAACPSTSRTSSCCSTRKPPRVYDERSSGSTSAAPRSPRRCSGPDGHGGAQASSRPRSTARDALIDQLVEIVGEAAGGRSV